MRVTWRALCLLSWGLLARRTFGLPANCWRAAVGLQVRAAIVSEQANAVAIAAVADPILQAHARNALLPCCLWLVELAGLILSTPDVIHTGLFRPPWYRVCGEL